jgi:hypothetical protein
MEQAGGIGFREVDQHGNPVPGDGLDPDSPSAQDTSSTTDEGAGRINPFIVTLWVLAVLLIAGGTGFFVGNAFSVPSMDGRPSPWSYLAIAFAPFAILSGVLAVLALLFWHAAQWRRRNGRRHSR